MVRIRRKRKEMASEGVPSSSAAPEKKRGKKVDIVAMKFDGNGISVMKTLKSILKLIKKLDKKVDRVAKKF